MDALHPQQQQPHSAAAVTTTTTTTTPLAESSSTTLNQRLQQLNPTLIQLQQQSALLPSVDLHQASDETYPFIIVVRALYPYRSEDSTTVSLSFQKDDLIQVVAQLESGWWYGFCNDARGWFPSNFVEEISQAELDDDEDDMDQDSQDEMA
ncbi:hypothetical protein BGZ65_003040, partial [Modicella reniformis]